MAVTLLMLIGVIAFFGVGVLGVIYIDVLGAAAGGWMIAAAAMFLIVVFGLLSRPRPLFLAGAVLTLASMLAAGAATFFTHAGASQLEQRILGSSYAVGGIITIDARSDIGKDLSLLRTARFVDAVATGLAFCLLVYLAVQSSAQLAARRRLTL